MLKAQEGKLSNTDMLLELTQSNNKLTAQVKDLEQNNKDLQERLQEVEEQLSNKIYELSEWSDKAEYLQDELNARSKQVEDLTEKNKKLAADQQTLTMRLLEEKAKWVEVMNEANSVYDKSMQRMGSTTE